jgi:hypothetical protein
MWLLQAADTSHNSTTAGAATTWQPHELGLVIRVPALFPAWREVLKPKAKVLLDGWHKQHGTKLLLPSQKHRSARDASTHTRAGPLRRAHGRPREQQCGLWAAAALQGGICAHTHRVTHHPEGGCWSMQATQVPARLACTLAKHKQRAPPRTAGNRGVHWETLSAHLFIWRTCPGPGQRARTHWLHHHPTSAGISISALMLATNPTPAVCTEGRRRQAACVQALPPPSSILSSCMSGKQPADGGCLHRQGPAPEPTPGRRCKRPWNSTCNSRPLVCAAPQPLASGLTKASVNTLCLAAVWRATHCRLGAPNGDVRPADSSPVVGRKTATISTATPTANAGTAQQLRAGAWSKSRQRALQATRVPLR